MLILLKFPFIAVLLVVMLTSLVIGAFCCHVNVNPMEIMFSLLRMQARFTNLQEQLAQLQEHAAELEDQLAQSRNLNNALTEKAEASEIDAVDAKLKLYKILVEAERCVEPATCDQEAIKGIWILVQRWRKYKLDITRHFQTKHEANIAGPSEIFPPSDLLSTIRKGKELALPERQGTELSSGDPGPSTSGEASVSKIFIPAPSEEFVVDPAILAFCSSLTLNFLSFQGILGSLWVGMTFIFSSKILIKKLRCLGKLWDIVKRWVGK